MATPLPWGQATSLCLALFSISFNNQLVSPIAPLMVASFHVTDDPAKIGYYAGFLASSLFLGGLFSSLLWGLLSDRIGRRPVILIGLVNVTICALVFGFSTSFTTAVLARFFSGLLNGVIIIARTAMSEICDESNQAKGYSILSLNRGLGLMFGPVIGGFLVFPADKYPWLVPRGSLLDHFAYLLPCLVVVFISTISLVLTVMFLPETKGWTKAAPKVIEDSSEDNLNQPLLDPLEVEERQKIPVAEEEVDDPGLLRVIFCEQETLIITIIYCLCGFMFVAFDQLFSLWAETDWDLGGLSFGSNQVALAQAAGGLSLIGYTVWLYPNIVNSLGGVQAVQISLLTGILQGGIPFLHLLGPRSGLLQVATIFVHVLRSFNECAMLALFVLTSNSVRYPQYMGAVTGMVQTAGLVFRAAAPTMTGSLFAWSITGEKHFPFDFHLAWFIMAALHVVTLIFTLYLPASVNKRKFVSAR